MTFPESKFEINTHVKIGVQMEQGCYPTCFQCGNNIQIPLESYIAYFDPKLNKTYPIVVLYHTDCYKSNIIHEVLQDLQSR